MDITIGLKKFSSLKMRSNSINIINLEHDDPNLDGKASFQCRCDSIRYSRINSDEIKEENHE